MGYAIAQAQTAEPLLFLMVDSSDHISPKTGLSPTVTISKNGTAFNTPSGEVSEVGNGWYKVAANADDSDTLGPLLLHATATNADPTDDQFDVVNYNPTAVTTGPTALSTSTGQAILDRMELLHPELQLQPGETDVAKGLIAANMAQSALDALLAGYPGILGDTHNTVATTADTETTTFPIGLLRVDKLQYLDSTGVVVWDLEPIYETGGHAPQADWLDATSSASTTTGIPRAYWTNGRAIFWDPTPDAAYTIRWYGFQAASALTASGTVTYPDICLLPIATFAVKLIRIGLDDDAQALQALAQEVFQPVVTALTGFRREGSRPLVYRYGHET